ncbi:MAG TPA: phosphatase PAP2 family protein [Burkholderiaceae bacterium]|nr:phosphatase PAP2 family protein [Burkholderiaceae bacterium]
MRPAATMAGFDKTALQGVVDTSDWRRLGWTIMTHFWFKCFGTFGFLASFFAAYFYLLNHPAYPVHVIPVTLVDRLIGFEPLALPVYFSAWVYVTLPQMLVPTRREVIVSGAWMGALCLTGLAIFRFWPNAVPPSDIRWELYPGMGFLKGVDATGNACPSLHVAASVYAAFRLNWQLPALGLPRSANWANAIWCVAIAYSTMATKQHVAVDVVAGAALGAVFALLARLEMLRPHGA